MQSLHFASQEWIAVVNILRKNVKNLLGKF